MTKPAQVAGCRSSGREGFSIILRTDLCKAWDHSPSGVRPFSCAMPVISLTVDWDGIGQSVTSRFCAPAVMKPRVNPDIHSARGRPSEAPVLQADSIHQFGIEFQPHDFGQREIAVAIWVGCVDCRKHQPRFAVAAKFAGQNAVRCK